MRIVVLFFAAFLGIVFAIFRGSVQGGLMGAALGMLEDLMTGRFIGINALCKGLLGYVAGISERNLYKNNFFVPIAAVLAATFLNAVLYYLFSVLIGSNVGLEKLMLSSIPDAVYNMCFSPVFYAIFYNFFVMKSND